MEYMAQPVTLYTQSLTVYLYRPSAICLSSSIGSFEQKVTNTVLGSWTEISMFFS